MDISSGLARASCVHSAAGWAEENGGSCDDSNNTHNEPEFSCSRRWTWPTARHTHTHTEGHSFIWGAFKGGKRRAEAATFQEETPIKMPLFLSLSSLYPTLFSGSPSHHLVPSTTVTCPPLTEPGPHKVRHRPRGGPRLANDRRRAVKIDFCCHPTN